MKCAQRGELQLLVDFRIGPRLEFNVLLTHVSFLFHVYKSHWRKNLLVADFSILQRTRNRSLGANILYTSLRILISASYSTVTSMLLQTLHELRSLLTRLPISTKTAFTGYLVQQASRELHQNALLLPPHIQGGLIRRVRIHL